MHFWAAVTATYEVKVAGPALSISSSAGCYVLREILVVAMHTVYGIFIAMIHAIVRNSCITRPTCADRLIQ